ncbi:MAG: FG-GAP-like repeat-containing protein [Verrucomicrobiota bacterium]|nr:FG-GAP-like repeat-containing protein [Verrucomicrobiota bacterium]
MGSWITWVFLVYNACSEERSSMPSYMNQTPYLLFLVIFLMGCRRDASGPVDPAGDAAGALPEQFFSLMNEGKNHLDRRALSEALAAYTQAANLVPHDPDVHLNLANAHLLGDASVEAIREADVVLKIDPHCAAAYFIKGSAYLRLFKAEEAVKSLENARKVDPGVTATFFQLGLGRMGLEQWEEAVLAFQEGIQLDPNRFHSNARYLLAQSLIRIGRREEAERELQLHQSGLDQEGLTMGAAVFEKCKHTRARIPFRLEQPDREGIPMAFSDVSQEVLGDASGTFSGPMGLIDVEHTGDTSLFVVERDVGFRLLRNRDGVFHPHDQVIPAPSASAAHKVLVGDLQNDRLEDIIVLGSEGSHLFAMARDGQASNLTMSSGLDALGATCGMLIDLDFTGKLDLVAVSSSSHAVKLWRQSTPLLFSELTRSIGIPATLQNARDVVMADWNRDQVMDLLVDRANDAPLLLEKQRGGPLNPQLKDDWTGGSAFCTGDFNNDLRPDLAVMGVEGIHLFFNGGEQKVVPVEGDQGFRQVVAVDYDNDGWLDLWAVGETMRAWRNVGLSGFQEQTKALGLDDFSGGPVSEVHFADFDRDCDPDAVVALAEGGLRFLRNEGGNLNRQVKVQMVGNRSNASGIGCRIEIQSGGLRLTRTVHRLPVEVGVGKHQILDSFLVHWFNWPQGSAKVPVRCQEPLLALELTIQEGSCPYLYAWDGKTFRFVTDFLGAAPLGLPIAEGRYIEADPEELVWVGNEHTFIEKDGAFQLRITEELREVLYLDEVKLVVVDREEGTEVHATDKLLPGKPYPPGSLVTLHREHPLLQAKTLQGREVTSELREVDGRRVSPPKLRSPQLRGLAEPHGCTLDFGVIDTSKPLALVMNGWLRFGGGMANVAASMDPSLPFPFPGLEAEVSPGTWEEVDLVVGAPAGKTKTILVDLEGQLKSGTRRLRLTSAFEIHWDRIALMEKQAGASTKMTWIQPSEAQLYFRGFSQWVDLPPDWPLTPDYDLTRMESPWTLTPSGWCTRYGDVRELIRTRDEGLLLLNSGDALALSFATRVLPPKPAGYTREFFIYADGWDKDSDFHVASGHRIEPLPYHGMEDQRYHIDERPSFPSDALHQKYNTRWVEGIGLRQVTTRQATQASRDLNQ